MQTGEIIDTALRVYQRLGLSFLRLSVAPTLLCLASLAFVGYFVLPGLFTQGDQGDFLAHVLDVGLAIFLAVFVGGPLFLAGLSYTTCIVVSLVSDFMVGNVPDLEAAQAAARKAMPRLFLVNLKELLLSLAGPLIATVIILLGEFLTEITPDSNVWAGVVAVVGVLAFIPGGVLFLWILAKDALVAPLVVLEDAGTRTAGKRSRQLMKNVRGHGGGGNTITSLYLLIAMIVVIVGGGIELCLGIAGADAYVRGVTSGVPLQPLILRAYELAPTFLIIWTIIPIWATAVTICYYDRRIRLEGFDIEILARDLAKRSSTGRYQL